MCDKTIMTAVICLNYIYINFSIVIHLSWAAIFPLVLNVDNLHNSFQSSAHGIVGKKLITLIQK